MIDIDSNLRLEIEVIQESLTNRIWGHPGQCVAKVWSPLMQGIDVFVLGKTDFVVFKGLCDTFRDEMIRAPWGDGFRLGFTDLLQTMINNQFTVWSSERASLQVMDVPDVDKQRSLRRLLALRYFEASVFGKVAVPSGL